MKAIHPWINFNGNAEEAFGFYRTVFGGEITKIVRLKDVPGLGEHVSAEEGEKIMRIELPLGQNVLIANDVPASMGRVSEEENRSKIVVSAESREEAARIFQSLSASGSVEVQGTENESEPFFAMLRDKYGIEWIVECGVSAE